MKCYTVDSVWSPSEFRSLLEAALTKALAESRERAARTRRDSERRARREALARRAALVVDEPRFPTSVSILTEDYFADAPKATGEEQDVVPDEADPYLAQAAVLLARGADERTMERLTGCSTVEAEAVPFRTQDAVAEDEELVAHLHRDEAPAPRGFGMTDAEMRRAWLAQARLDYSAKLAAALAKHRNRLGVEAVKQFPALRSEVQHARAIIDRHRFVDELARHGVHHPDAELVTRLKTELTRGQYRETYHNAYMELAWRRTLAERGQYDRFTNELV